MGIFAEDKMKASGFTHDIYPSHFVREKRASVG